jgi:hypothetical protein
MRFTAFPKKVCNDTMPMTVRHPERSGAGRFLGITADYGNPERIGWPERALPLSTRGHERPVTSLEIRVHLVL